MAQLQARKKPRTEAGSELTLTPIALLLAAGLFTMLLVKSGPEFPVPVLTSIRPAVVALVPRLQGAWLMYKTYEVNGKAWKLASLTPVTDFSEFDMVPIELTGHHRIFANRSRGVSGLGRVPKPFDRLYLELRPHVYAALRWRDVP